ncbi:ergothioneine biosynthesis protein EgtC [Leptolyngbya sp. FACHB-261]|uniref:ergothioneine biosynthesis protein EgtC n=1 Tax=Leptolyngbya sp. FACHB-261 TaxID=2692806 RepID=UPI001683C456|nr:ergothioneine biosynthesis protein EgtC [Leptolyngbya sp. FACHB-261]MBD2104541.1 ergothioneine biosynthesis protein EgtC [Leptolyngbya sp. FACHB-261]
MCRLTAYLGPAVSLGKLLLEPEHSLLVQSYKPQEMANAVVNADGFGVGWYHPQRQIPPCVYTNIIPMWNDINFPNLGTYLESSCILANVRSATTGIAVDQSNCQPFRYDNLLFTHNGYITNFRKTLMRPIRDSLSDEYYQAIQGTSDSEHIFALFLNYWQQSQLSLVEALDKTVQQLVAWAGDSVGLALNLLVTDGNQVAGVRTNHQASSPSLYWQQGEAALIASEPLSPEQAWSPCPDHHLLSVNRSGQFQFEAL